VKKKMTKAREVFLAAHDRLKRHQELIEETGGVRVYEFRDDIVKLIEGCDHRIPLIGVQSICSAIACVIEGSLFSVEEWHERSVGGSVIESIFRAGLSVGLHRAESYADSARPAKRKAKK
jgi:hypothetical protein